MGGELHVTPVTVKWVASVPTTERVEELMEPTNVPPVTPLIVTPVVVEPMARPCAAAVVTAQLAPTATFVTWKTVVVSIGTVKVLAPVGVAVIIPELGMAPLKTPDKPKNQT